MLPGPVNTLRYLFGGEGDPLVLLSMPVRPYGLTGTALPPFGRRQRERGGLPPKSPNPSPARFYQGKSWDKGRITRQGRRSMYILFQVYIEIISKICVNRPWSVFVLKKGKREAAAQRRPAQTSRKNRVFFRKTTGRMVWNAARIKLKMRAEDQRPGQARRGTSPCHLPQYEFLREEGGREGKEGAFCKSSLLSPANSKLENQRAPKPGTWKRRSSQCRSQVARVTMTR